MANNNMKTEEFPPLTKELAQKFMAMKGECRGMGIKSDWEVILKAKSKEGLAKLEAKMAELGYPLKYEEIKTMNFYPIGYDVLSMLAMRDVFGFTEKDFEELGEATIKFSLFVKTLIKYFTSLEMIVAQAPRVWRQHYTIGELEIIELNEKEKYAIFGVKNFAIHPVLCVVIKGFLSGTVKLLMKSTELCQETKCTFQGDEYHEFLVKW